MTVKHTARMPLRVRLVVTVTVLLALALLPLSRLVTGSLGGIPALVAALILAVLIAGAHRFPVHIGPKRKANVSTIPEVAAVLLLPGLLAVTTLTAGVLAGEVHRRTPPIQWLFNAALAAIRAVVGGLINATLLRALPSPLAEPAAALAALTAMHALTTALVTAITAVHLRENPFTRAILPQRDLLLSEIVLALTGVIVALAAAEDAWALPLAIAPAAIAWRALRDGVALRVQTRAAVEELADIVDMRDHYTAEHCRRVADLARLTAQRLGLPNAEVELVALAARVHDVGKIGIKSSILMKPDQLTEAEWREMRTHPEIGARLLRRFPEFARGSELVLHHHERYDGTGYPHHLAGDRIPLGARILAVVDAWDAMTSQRAYRSALDPAHARAQLLAGRGAQFDPKVVDAFIALLEERPTLAHVTAHPRQEVDTAPGAHRYVPGPAVAGASAPRSRPAVPISRA